MKSIKNTQYIRYHIHRELQHYSVQRNKSEKNKINIFIIPILSAAVSIAVTIASVKYRASGDLCEFILPITTLLAFLASYALILLIFKGVRWLFVRFIKQCRPISLKNNNPDQEQEIAIKFNYSIMNLAYFSYSLSIFEEKDEKLAQYNYSETVYYLEKTLTKIAQIFLNNQNGSYRSIKEYRLKIALGLLCGTIKVLSKLPDGEFAELKADLETSISNYNDIVKQINNIYNKSIGEQIM